MLSPVDQIKERLSIVDVLSLYLKLEKSGTNFRAKCPFHNEKTPSFFISPGRNTFHCFGCNRGGDIFTFTQDIEGIDFKEALKLLAERAGVSLADAPKNGDEKSKLYRVLEIGTRFFEAYGKKNNSVQDYLKSRGMSEETIKDFRVGFAPDAWRTLTSFFAQKKVPEKLVEESGLAIRSGEGKGVYDRFRSRIMFPIMDSQGRVVAFSGRIFAPKENKEEAKYVNSPETKLFNKSSILYGYDKAKRAIMQRDACILVEGQFDLCMAHQAGSTNTVATSGTALTENHLLLIKRFTDKLFFAYDGDEAGLKATKRGIEIALSLSMDVQVIALPLGVDPGELIANDVNDWLKRVENPKPIITFLADVLKEKKIPDRDARKEIEKTILPYLARVQSMLDQSFFIQELSAKFGIPESDLRSALVRIPKDPNIQMPSELLAQKKASSLLQEIKQKLFGIFLFDTENKYQKEKEIYSKISEIKLEDEIEKIPDAEKENIRFQIEMTYAKNTDMKIELHELLTRFEMTLLEERLALCMKKLAESEQKKDVDSAKEILAECHEISKKLESIKRQGLAS